MMLRLRRLIVEPFTRPHVEVHRTSFIFLALTFLTCNLFMRTNTPINVVYMHVRGRARTRNPCRMLQQPFCGLYDTASSSRAPALAPPPRSPARAIAARYMLQTRPARRPPTTVSNNLCRWQRRSRWSRGRHPLSLRADPVATQCDQLFR